MNGRDAASPLTGSFSRRGTIGLSSTDHALRKSSTKQYSTFHLGQFEHALRGVIITSWSLESNPGKFAGITPNRDSNVLLYRPSRYWIHENNRDSRMQDLDQVIANGLEMSIPT